MLNVFEWFNTWLISLEIFISPSFFNILISMPSKTQGWVISYSYFTSLLLKKFESSMHLSFSTFKSKSTAIQQIILSSYFYYSSLIRPLLIIIIKLPIIKSLSIKHSVLNFSYYSILILPLSFSYKWKKIIAWTAFPFTVTLIEFLILYSQIIESISWRNEIWLKLCFSQNDLIVEFSFGDKVFVALE